MNKIQVYGLTRISKPRARKLWAERKPFFICPVNLRPGQPWHPDMHVDPVRWENEGIIDFDFMVRSFESANCVNTETGAYASYWIEN